MTAVLYPSTSSSLFSHGHALWQKWSAIKYLSSLHLAEPQKPKNKKQDSYLSYFFRSSPIHILLP